MNKLFLLESMVLHTIADKTLFSYRYSDLMVASHRKAFPVDNHDDPEIFCEFFRLSFISDGRIPPWLLRFFSSNDTPDSFPESASDLKASSSSACC